MKVGVTSAGREMTSPVDPRFGRSAGFVVVDTESGDSRYVDNAQNVNAPQGAGIQAARIIADEGVDCVVTGHCGPNAYRTLAAAGIKVALAATGTVAEAVKALVSGALKPAESADVEGHWV
jgi:predicted Fe-Mo cluster-binding NifX family protein